MKLLSFFIVLLALLPACNGIKPPPVDCRTTGCDPGFVCEEKGDVWRCVPVPETEPPIAMLLRNSGDGRFANLDGVLVDLLAEIPCCVPVVSALEALDGLRVASEIVVDGERIVVGWPCAIRQVFRDWAEEKTAGKVNMYHCRLGPFFADATAESDWIGIGGAYLRVPDGRADLTRFNPAFWDLVYDDTHGAGMEGSYVEVSFLDRWWYKQNPAIRPNPMRPEWNIQEYDFNVGHNAIEPGSFRDQWLLQVVCRPDNPKKALGRLPNIIFEDGNEVGLGGYDPVYTFSMRERVRVHEAACSVPVHLFGTNANKPAAEAGPVDYVSRHQGNPIPSPITGKPSYVNEYNPRPPFTPAQVQQKFCAAKGSRTYFAHWFHGQTQPQIEETMRLLAAGCGPAPPPPTGCTFPQGLDDRITKAPRNPGEHIEKLDLAMAAVTGCAVRQEPCPVNVHVDVWFAQVCAELRRQGMCCGRHDNIPPGASDQISVKATDFCDGGIHENYRIINPREDGVRWGASAKLDAWNVVCPIGLCTNPDPTGLEAQFVLKPHHQDWDSTYRVKSFEYCTAAGFTNRTWCPLRPEGASDREVCERKHIGTQKWWCDGQPIESNDNPAQARCHGHVRTCTESESVCSEADWL